METVPYHPSPVETIITAQIAHTIKLVTFCMRSSHFDAWGFPIHNLNTASESGPELNLYTISY